MESRNNSKNDAVILISKSGNTSEIKDLIPFLKFKHQTYSSFISKNSYLSKNCDYFLKSFVEKEAGFNNLAPTTSTTAQLVIECHTYAYLNSKVSIALILLNFIQLEF